jgi:hypothetical protein
MPGTGRTHPEARSPEVILTGTSVARSTAQRRPRTVPTETATGGDLPSLKESEPRRGPDDLADGPSAMTRSSRVPPARRQRRVS